MPPRVVFPYISLRHHGGVRNLVSFMNHLAERGYWVTALVPKNQFRPLYKIHPDVELLFLRRSNEQGSFSKMKTLWDLYKAIKGLGRVDLVVVNFFPTAYPVYLARRDYKVLYLFQDLPQFFSGAVRLSLDLSLRLPFRKVVISSFIKESSEIEAEVVPCGVEEAFFPEPDPALLEEKGHPAVLYFPRKQAYKGYPVFLETVRLLKERGLKFEVWLVTKEEETLNEFERMDVPAFLMPADSDEDLRRVYSSADVFVSSSLYEGFNLPPLEAMACGTPVAMTDSGGSREYAQNEVNALVVPPGDAEALAGAVERLLLDEELRARLVRAGLETAKRFTMRQFTERLEEIVAEVLAQ